LVRFLFAPLFERFQAGQKTVIRADVARWVQRLGLQPALNSLQGNLPCRLDWCCVIHRSSPASCLTVYMTNPDARV